MQVQIHYQGMDSSQWMDQFISNKVAKLHRYLSNSATIQVNLKFENKNYTTSLSIHNLNHDYAFSADGVNLYESFSNAADKATRSLGEHKRMLKDKINRRFFSLKSSMA